MVIHQVEGRCFDCLRSIVYHEVSVSVLSLEGKKFGHANARVIVKGSPK